MKNHRLKTYLVVLLVALVPSIGCIRIHSMSNVSFCLYSAGCIEQNPVGKITTYQYGYPLTYRTTSTFEPLNNNEKVTNYAGYASTSVELQGFSIANIIINIIFWFGLLGLAADLALKKYPATKQNKSF